jgi:arabinofuranan 3-O-arabinosyltransferase
VYRAVVSRIASLPSALRNAFRPRTSPPSTQDVVRTALWPIAIMSIIHRSYVLTTNGYITDDWAPVYWALRRFRHHEPVYTDVFVEVDPHYLYPPGGTLLMSPFAYIESIFAARNWFIVLNTVAIILACVFLVRLFKFKMSSPALPALLAAAFVTESVTNTLVFTNINGCILLCEVLFLCWLLDGRQSREWLSGFAIGLSLTVKPVLAPLLLIPLLNRQWRVLAMAMAVPLALNIVAWRMVIDRRAFLEGTIPYILSTRDYFNSSVLGNGIYYGLPMWLITALRVLFVILAAGSLWLLYRYYRQRDTFFWVLTSSGVLLTASWLVLSLAQGYYSMMLFPFLMTVVLPNSVLRNWPAWLATYGFLTLDRWLMWRWPTTGRFLEYMKITYGWSLMLIVVFCVLLFRYLDAREDGRLADGIDPPWMEQAARERRLAPT